MKHPNAVVGGATGLTGGELIVELLQQHGVSLSPGWNVAIAAAFTFVALTLGKAGAIVMKSGLVGLWHVIVHGEGPKA